jgi:hypothetical protein
VSPLRRDWSSAAFRRLGQGSVRGSRVPPRCRHSPFEHKFGREVLVSMPLNKVEYVFWDRIAVLIARKSTACATPVTIRAETQTSPARFSRSLIFRPRMAWIMFLGFSVSRRHEGLVLGGANGQHHLVCGMTPSLALESSTAPLQCGAFFDGTAAGRTWQGRLPSWTLRTARRSIGRRQAARRPIKLAKLLGKLEPGDVLIVTRRLQ